jgi:hypothetical protein
MDDKKTRSRSAEEAQTEESETKPQTDPATPKIYGDGRPVAGEVVTVLHARFNRRILNLAEAKSRALLQNEIHELMVVDEREGSAIAFFEVKKGGVAVVGDEVTVDDKPIGKIAGFDMNHMPNHMNIVIKTRTNRMPQTSLGDRVTIQRSGERT